MSQKLSQKIFSLRPGGGYLRAIEYFALLIVLLAVSLVCYLFFGVFTEHNKRLDVLGSEDKQTRADIENFKAANDKNNRQNNQTQAALKNLEEFNQRFLKDQTKGRLLLIDQINNLAKKDDLALQGSISFQTIQDADVVAARELKRKGSVRQSKSDTDIYPGLHASFTVAGSYENFRKFLHDMETGDLFVVIEKLNLQTADQQQQQMGGSIVRNTQPRQVSADNGNLNVQIDLKAYFRKQAVAINDAANK
jgi:hypothetical protein